MSTWYYYNENGQKFGPVGGSELKQLVQQGWIARATVVETESGQKARAEKVKGLFQVPSPTTPDAPQIAFSCSSCNHRLKVRGEHAGRTLRCPTCRATITVPTAPPKPVSVARSQTIPVAAFAAAPTSEWGSEWGGEWGSEWGNEISRLLEESANAPAPVAMTSREAREPVRPRTRRRQNSSEGIGYFDIVTKKYALFSGRAGRKEFWTFWAVNMSVCIVFWVLMLTIAFAYTECPQHEEDEILVGGAYSGVFNTIMIVYRIFLLFILIPMLAVSVRRLHDIGLSGWVIFINLFIVLCIGPIIFLVLMLRDSLPENNVYGPTPQGYW